MDRDGVINELVYHPEFGIIDSPLNPEELKIIDGVPEAIKKLNELGFKVVIVSNQPAIAKGKTTMELFNKIREKMKQELKRAGAIIDSEYYCFHHPEAKLPEYRVNCNCRKPKPGLLLKAAKELNIDLSKSYMIGDGLTDIIAGKLAGCKTILIGKLKCDICKLMDELDARPNFIAKNLTEAVEIIINNEINNEKTYKPLKY